VSSSAPRLAVVAVFGLHVGAALGCGSNEPVGGGASAAPSGSAAGSSGSAASGSAASAVAASAVAAEPEVPWIGIPRSRAEVEKIVNPKAAQPYSGPTATLRGTIRIKGDPPPDMPVTIPPECAPARDVYGKAFRVGSAGELADALVAVTNYEGFVPATSPAREVVLNGCAFDRRTYAAAYGQRIEVRNTDAKLSFMPYLDGAPYRSLMLALPGGAPTKSYPIEPGRYVLRDFQPRPFLTADVFVLKYATADTTGVDGRYELRGLPVGKARIDALLPSIAKSDGRDLDLQPGDNTLDLELTFDAKTDKVVAAPPDPSQRGSSTTERPEDIGKYGHPPLDVPPAGSGLPEAPGIPAAPSLPAVPSASSK
jgi:hypothetical protein